MECKSGRDTVDCRACASRTQCTAAHTSFPTVWLRKQAEASCENTQSPCFYLISPWQYQVISNLKHRSDINLQSLLIRVLSLFVRGLFLSLILLKSCFRVSCWLWFLCNDIPHSTAIFIRNGQIYTFGALYRLQSTDGLFCKCSDFVLEGWILSLYNQEKGKECPLTLLVFSVVLDTLASAIR